MFQHLIFPAGIAKILGTTKKIVAKDSKTFAHEIAKYIDSKDQKRGDKKDKKKKDEEKAKAKEGPSLMDTLRGKDKPKKDKDNSEGPAFWPLIRQVNVRCNSQALSTGAVLVDLPGVADANAARNSIAKGAFYIVIASNSQLMPLLLSRLYEEM